MKFHERLFSSYLNLSTPLTLSPLHCYGPLFASRELIEERELPRIQATVMPSFRSELYKVAGMYSHCRYKVQNLEESMQTDEWRYLVDYIGNYQILSTKSKAVVLRLLCKLCMYDQVLCLENGFSQACATDQAIVEMCYWVSVAKYALWLDGRHSDYSINLFKEVREISKRPCLSRIDATYQMVVQSVKHQYDLQATEYWQDVHAKELDNIQGEVSDFVFGQLKSRFHRVGGFIPQMKEDKVAVASEMELAEKAARDLFKYQSSSDERLDVYQICAKEMLHPVLESRTKEALWLGDIEKAHSRVVEMTKISPTDSRAFLQLGEVLIEMEKYNEAIRAYQRAAIVAPPGGEVAHFMLAQLNKRNGDSTEAVNNLIKSISWDIEGVSSVEMLKEEVDSDHDLFEVLNDWIEEIDSRKENKNIANPVQPYQVRQLNQKV